MEKLFNFEFTENQLNCFGQRMEKRWGPLHQIHKDWTNNAIASSRRQLLKDNFDLKEHQLEALQLTAERQNYPAHEMFGDVTSVLASGFFDTESVIHNFTCGQNVRLVHGLYQMQISNKIDEQKDVILFENGMKIGLELLDKTNIHRGFKL